MEQRNTLCQGLSERLAKDGGVEGHVLTPSYENTGITTKCWTTIHKKKLEPTQKDTLHPKTKKKPQWYGRRGAITIKSYPIPVTHKLENNYTTEVLPLEWKFWAPHQVSQPGGPATGGGASRESGFEDKWSWITGIRRDWGKQRLYSWRACTRTYVHQDPWEKKAVIP